ncbi:hydroxyisourate hydrolase [Roseomonas sp. SSH11]|uniref:5-hydroxyisourate hydrolase n=1 Tax=Pararoseomonas baculiformis TaxID=2820812 RepID=A0ABS4AFC5_9PROT|nr:hydroxyisourate hydrolase [Pararoseomonas baculiformis]MBP0445225.1 hydroxyisourate hydrolase [Pararoseomonas baculiformis]
MKPSALSTHVLDTANGIPAAGMALEFWRMEPVPVLLAQAVTNADGRTDAPLLSPEGFRPGRYELRFDVGGYFAARGEDAGYLGTVVINVGLREGSGHYHVPLLCSPWSYSTYRGS